MKTRFLLLAVTALAALSIAPVALAHGKPDDAAAKADKQAQKAACGQRVGVVLKGTLTAVDATAMTVTVAVGEANDHGARFKGQTLTLKLGEGTKIRRHGRAEITDLVAGDLVKLMAKGCTKQLDDPAATPELVVKHLKAKSADEATKPAESTSEDGKPAGQQTSQA